MMFVETIEASQTILEDDCCGFPNERNLHSVIQCFMATNEGLTLKVFHIIIFNVNDTELTLQSGRYWENQHS